MIYLVLSYPLRDGIMLHDIALFYPLRDGIMLHIVVLARQSEDSTIQIDCKPL